MSGCLCVSLADVRGALRALELGNVSDSEEMADLRQAVMVMCSSPAKLATAHPCRTRV